MSININATVTSRNRWKYYLSKKKFDKHIFTNSLYSLSLQNANRLEFLILQEYF